MGDEQRPSDAAYRVRVELFLARVRSIQDSGEAMSDIIESYHAWRRRHVAKLILFIVGMLGAGALLSVFRG